MALIFENGNRLRSDSDGSVFAPVATSGITDYTWGLWINVFGGGTGILDHFIRAGAGTYVRQLSNNSPTQVQTIIRNGGGVSSNTTGLPGLNQWIHFLVTNDADGGFPPPAGLQRIYLNGLQIAQLGIPSSAVSTTAQTMTVGALAGGLRFKAVDLFGLNEFVTPAEAQALGTATSRPDDIFTAHPSADGFWWRFDEKSTGDWVPGDTQDQSGTATNIHLGTQLDLAVPTYDTDLPAFPQPKKPGFDLLGWRYLRYSLATWHRRP